MPDARTRRVLGLRRSGASGPHGKGRREAPDPADEIAEAIAEQREHLDDIGRRIEAQLGRS